MFVSDLKHILIRFKSAERLKPLKPFKMKTSFLSILVALFLTSFTAVANDNIGFGKVSVETNNSTSKVIINWEANKGAEADYFEIERSFDQVNFQTAGIVLDALTTNNEFKYFSFKDNDVLLKDYNKVYYRLKRINANKTISLSKVIFVDFTNARQVEFDAMNIASQNIVNIDFQSKKSGTADVFIYNQSNQLIAQSTYEVAKGSNLLQIAHMSNFPEGTYRIELSLKGSSIAAHKVVIH